MLKPEQVPYDVVRAAYAAWAGGGGNNVLSAMESAIAAAINAWPGVYANGLQKGWKHYTPALILPIPPQETDNDR